MNLFIRSQDNLAVYNGGGSGRILTESEVEATFGPEILALVIREGAVSLPASESEPSQTIRARRESLGLTLPQLASFAGISVSEAEALECPSLVSSIRTLEKVAIVLGLDERLLTFKPGAGGDARLAARLKSLKGGKGFTPKVVSTLAGASWVVQTQKRLSAYSVTNADQLPDFEPSDNYGDRVYPAWWHGYYLAEKTRERLGLDAGAPIGSLRELCARFSIPIIKAELPASLAGATIATNDARGIVINVSGQNTNVWVRRATVAHELGHLLWDPDPRLAQVTVDRYADLSALDRARPDHVEARANAFAIAFLAPPSAVEPVFRSQKDSAEGVRRVMEHFGISLSAAKLHIQNIMKISLPEPLVLEDIDPTEDWIGREAFTEDYFPIAETPLCRRGEFSAAVVAAQRAGRISSDTAATYLLTDTEHYQAASGQILELFS